MLIGFTGRIGCGKSVAAKYLEEKYGFRRISFVDKILSRELFSRGLEMNRRNLQRIGREIFERYGDTAMAEWLLKDLDNGKYVIDDIRYPGTAVYFRKKLGKNFYLIGIIASQSLRYKRVLARSISEKNLSIEEFAEIDTAPSEAGIDETVKLADWILENESTLEELYRKLDKIMVKILE